MNNRPCRKGCSRGCVNRHRPAGSVLRVVAWGQGYCHLTFDIFPTKEKTELFSDVRFIPVIADVCLPFQGGMAFGCEDNNRFRYNQAFLA